ncbi:hypothetical protein D5074_12210 [Pectobacterium polaris]|nr:hypothetical protein D5074_12210 [Pectobacterium polaris]
MRWLRLLTRITYSSKLIGIPSLAACLQLELFRVYRYFFYKKNQSIVFLSVFGSFPCATRHYL